MGIWSNEQLGRGPRRGETLHEALGQHTPLITVDGAKLALCLALTTPLYVQHPDVMTF